MKRLGVTLALLPLLLLGGGFALDQWTTWHAPTAEHFPRSDGRIIAPGACEAVGVLRGRGAVVLASGIDAASPVASDIAQQEAVKRADRWLVQAFGLAAAPSVYGVPPLVEWGGRRAWVYTAMIGDLPASPPTFSDVGMRPSAAIILIDAAAGGRLDAIAVADPLVTDVCLFSHRALLESALRSPWLWALGGYVALLAFAAVTLILRRWSQRRIGRAREQRI